LRAAIHALLCVLLLGGAAVAADAPPPARPSSQQDTLDVIGEFARGDDVKSEVVAIPDQKKRLIMFFMGVPLLIFILITAGLGVALGVYGKRVYLPHMIFAGLSVTLAIAHAVVGIVWFYPF
jgi:hypothetical protein